MNLVKDELVAKLNEINSKLSQNLELSQDELQTLFLSSLWSEESNECN